MDLSDSILLSSRLCIRMVAGSSLAKATRREFARPVYQPRLYSLHGLVAQLDRAEDF